MCWFSYSKLCELLKNAHNLGADRFNSQVKEVYCDVLHGLNIHSFCCPVCGKYANRLSLKSLTPRAPEARNSVAVTPWVSLYLMDVNNLGSTILIDLEGINKGLF